VPPDSGEGVALGAAGPVEVVARAARILRLLGESTAELTTTQIAERAGLPRSTVHRIVGTLHELRLVVHEPPGRLRLGPEVARLAADARIELVRAVQPHLVELSRSVGETAGLAVLEGHRVRFLDTAVAARPAPVSLVCSVPAHCTANGKALLAALPEPALDSVLPERLASLTPRSIATHEALRAELDRVRRDGVAYSREEYADGICGVGMAIHDGSGHVGAITVAAPATRFYGRETALTGALGATVTRVDAELAAVGLRVLTATSGYSSP